jgi:hypothetical protein
VRMLLYSQIPHITGVGAMIPQHRFLTGRGKQPVSRYANTLANSTDISGEVRRRSLSGLTAEDWAPRS